MAAYDNPPRNYRAGYKVLLEKDRDGKPFPLADESTPCQFVLFEPVIGSTRFKLVDPDTEWPAGEEDPDDPAGTGPGLILPYNAPDAQAPFRLDVSDLSEVYLVREALSAEEQEELAEQEATEETEAEEAEEEYNPPRARVNYIYAATE